MPEPFGEDNIEELLTAFGDGELTAEQTVRLLEYVADHPQVLEKLDQEQRIRIAARRTILNDTPAAPATLRANIEAMAVQREHGSVSITATNPSRRFFALAATIALLIGGIAAYIIVQNRNAAPITFTTSNLKLATFAQAATLVHVDCSRMLGNHTGGIPKELGALSENLRADLSRDVSYPDLTAVGYEFVGAGPCAKPLETTVHLLYRAINREINDTLSVFVQPNTSKFDLELGRLYLLTTDNAAHPIYAWRTAKVVYLLVGNNADVVKKVSESINLAKL